MSIQQIVNLRRKANYYQHDAPDWVRNVWNRPESFDWFVKNNKDVLCAQGALVKLGRDFFVDTQVFPSAAEHILGLTPAEAGEEAVSNA
jgi:hypothetical protein